MKLNKKVIIAGDMHGYWRYLNALIARRTPEIILQCGDFGWWPKFDRTKLIERSVTISRNQKPWLQQGVKPGKSQIYFAPGNHEDWWNLNDLTKVYGHQPLEVMPQVHYMPRGSTLDLPDGRRVLFMGGANSTDRQWRKMGHDWFPEEVITNSDLNLLPETDIDIVISHTCPSAIFPQLTSDFLHLDSDPSRLALSYILEEYDPKLWFFGHFHMYKSSIYNNTKWYCLNMAPYTNWWTYLPEA